LFDAEFGTTLRTVVEIVLLILLLWWPLESVRTYEAALRASQQDFQRTAPATRSTTSSLAVSRSDALARSRARVLARRTAKPQANAE